MVTFECKVPHLNCKKLKILKYHNLLKLSHKDYFMIKRYVKLSFVIFFLFLARQPLFFDIGGLTNLCRDLTLTM